MNTAPPGLSSRSGFPWALLAGAGLLLFSRNPQTFLHPQLWAEDGRVWLEEAYNYGAASLFWPRAGYLQTFSRLVALAGLVFPFTALPRFFVVVSFLVQLLPAGLLLSARARALMPWAPARMILVFYYIVEPNSSELFVNLTNAMWHLALAGLLIVVLEKPQSMLMRMTDMAVLALSGLSGPLGLYIAPIAWWETLRQKGSGYKIALTYAVVTSCCAMVQIACLMTHKDQRIGHLGASFGRFVHIIADQIVLGSLLGARITMLICQMPFWRTVLPASMVCLAAGCLLMAALRYGTHPYRMLVLFSALLLVSALARPLVTLENQWEAMQYPGAGDRYYVIPMLALFAGATMLAGNAAARDGKRGWRFFLLLTPFIIGIGADWRLPDKPSTGYQAVAARFDAAPPGFIADFPEAPSPWHFILTKK